MRSTFISLVIHAAICSQQGSIGAQGAGCCMMVMAAPRAAAGGHGGGAMMMLHY
jgi:hypothetical protein